MKKLWLGAGFGSGGRDPTCMEGPTLLIPRLQAKLGGEIGTIVSEPGPEGSKIERWKTFSLDLAQVTSHIPNDHLPLIIGGDHSVALGTWAGIRAAQDRTTALPMGMVWVDAHMDSHRPETTRSGNPHGMVLAALLGYGPTSVTQLLRDPPVVSARHLTLIGVRSYEPEEMELLDGIGVRVITMDEVNRRGLPDVMKEAVDRANHHTCGWGLSVDLDVLDPSVCCAVCVPEPGGVLPEALFAAFKGLPRERLLGIELVEYCPSFDRNSQTADLTLELMRSLVE
jgi:arginase